jgi:hypothetical protein
MKAMEPRDPKMCAYYGELEEKFKAFEPHHSYKRFNTEADELSTIALGQKPVSNGVFASDLYEPSVKIKQVEEGSVEGTNGPVAPLAHANKLVATTDQQDWRQPLVNLLSDRALPEDTTETRRISQKAKSSVIIDRTLYKKSALGIKQKCITYNEGRQLLAEMHEGTCGPHVRSSGRRSSKDSIGQLPCPTPSRSFVPVRAASTTHDKHTCRLKPSRPFPLPGHLRFGDWTWSGPSRKHQRVAPTCLWRWISSPNGSRPDQLPSSHHTWSGPSSSTVSGCPTPSSSITEPNLRGSRSSSSAMTSTFVLTG